MPLVSAEVRWFVDASAREIVEAFTRWFESGAFPPAGGAPRTDVYGVDRGVTDVGIKRRGKSPGVEVKTQVDPCVAATRFAGRDVRIESWTKTASRAIELSRHAVECSVRKTRRLRTFDTGAGSAEEVELGRGESTKDASLRVTTGCNVEWTRVEVEEPATEAWSFGLEAFGDDPRRSIVLTLDALDARSPPSLGEAWREESYPAWLARLLGTDAAR
jgi:hypothetical protein